MLCIWLALVTALALVACGEHRHVNLWSPASRRGELIKVGIINLDPSESSYRAANVKDMEERFTRERGYDASFSYSEDHEEQIELAKQYIKSGVKYLLLAAADTAGWDLLLKDAQAAGVFSCGTNDLTQYTLACAFYIDYVNKKS